MRTHGFRAAAHTPATGGYAMRAARAPGIVSDVPGLPSPPCAARPPSSPPASSPVLSDDNARRYVKALYPVGILLMLVPVVDLTLRALPVQLGTLQWRFATVGLLLGNYGTIILGAALIGLAAALVGDRGPLRAVGIGALAMAAITVAVLVGFMLDAVQIRTLAAANFKRPILASSAAALFTGALGTIAWVVIGRAALAASRPARGSSAARTRAGSPLVVSAPTTSGEAV